MTTIGILNFLEIKMLISPNLPAESKILFNLIEKDYVLPPRHKRKSHLYGAILPNKNALAVDWQNGNYLVSILDASATLETKIVGTALDVEATLTKLAEKNYD